MATKVRSARGSKKKGADYERELAAYLNERTGLESRRALLSGGGRNEGGADLDDTPMIHVEAKRVENVSPYAHINQAETAISKGKDKSVMPVVVTRRNNMTTGQSLVVMRLDDWLVMYQALLQKNPSLASAAPIATPVAAVAANHGVEKYATAPLA